MDIGTKLKNLREAKGLTLRQLQNLTEKMGHCISHTTIMQFEKYNGKPTSKGIIKIYDLKILCACLDYPFAQFLEEVGYLEPAKQTNIQETAEKMNESQRQLWTKLGEQILNEDIQAFLNEAKNLENKD